MHADVHQRASLVQPIRQVASRFDLNWRPLLYTHPAWYPTLGIGESSSEALRLGSRQWTLLNEAVLRRGRLLNRSCARLDAMDPWWTESPDVVVGFATRISVLLIAARISLLLAGPQIAQFESKLGPTLIKIARARLIESTPWRMLIEDVRWHRFEKAPNPIALGLQVLLSQLEDHQSGMKMRMALRCEPGLLKYRYWRGELHETVMVLIEESWTRYRKNR